jgi:hypothetical protein
MTTASSENDSKPTNKEIQEWWNWLLSIPHNKSPLLGGTHVSEGQTMSVWCLACTGGKGGIGGIDPHIRKLDATSAQKDVLIPVFVAGYTEKEAGVHGKNAMEAARDFVKDPEEIVLEVDGRPVKPHYLEMGPFKVSITANHVCDCHEEDLGPGDYTDFYTAGYWLRLPHPKTQKTYNIKFGGSNMKRNNFKTQVTYEVKV